MCQLWVCYMWTQALPIRGGKLYRPASDEDAQVGALIDAAAVDNVESLVADAVEHGLANGSLVLEGSDLPPLASFARPATRC